MFRDAKRLLSWELTQPNLNLGTFYDTELNSEGEDSSRGLLRDYESMDGPSFEALVIAENRGLITGRVMKPLQLLHTQLPAGGNTEVGGRDQKTIL